MAQRFWNFGRGRVIAAFSLCQRVKPVSRGGRNCSMAFRALRIGTGLLTYESRPWNALWPVILAALLSVAVLVVAAGSAATVWAQDGTPEPEPAMDVCLVSLNAENSELALGETMRLWIWGVGVEPGSLNLDVEGAGSVGLRGVREVDSWAELVELTVEGAAEGTVEIAASMVCREPGNGTDALILTVSAPERGANAAEAPPAMDDFCVVQLSVSDEEVAVGDEFFAWFVGGGTEERSWDLEMDGDGSARVLGAREIDPQYVEWRMEAVAAGDVQLTGAMDCRLEGEARSTGKIVILERDSEIGQAAIGEWANGSAGASQDDVGRRWGTAAMVQVGLIAVLAVALIVLAYVAVRRR